MSWLFIAEKQEIIQKWAATERQQLKRKEKVAQCDSFLCLFNGGDVCNIEV
jgi:hypothetical protein